MVTNALYDLLLTRRGLVAIDGQAQRVSPQNQVEAVALEWAALGYVPSTRLQERLKTAPKLAAIKDQVSTALAAKLGANQKHVPLFRRFPDDVPKDTFALWVKKVLAFYFQDKDQPCLTCGGGGSTHVLSCHHVVCERCFDGSNYSACPVCEQPVDPRSPYFKPHAPLELPVAKVRYKWLDLTETPVAEAEALFLQLVSRAQALSPVDKAALTTLLEGLGLELLKLLPAAIPVKEIMAQVFGTLWPRAPERVLTAARPHLRTATDVLRLMAVLSGADPALQKTSRFRLNPQPGDTAARVTFQSERFNFFRPKRAERRLLLGLLETFPPTALLEDMLRHRSLWLAAGERLHPHEFAKRFPNVVSAFKVLHKKSPDGVKASRFRGFYSQLAALTLAGDAYGMLALLAQRPGELGRRFDHLLRVAGADEGAVAAVVNALSALAPSLSTPVLLSLAASLPTRTARAKLRIYWPKGQVSKGVSAPDRRTPLPLQAVTSAHLAVIQALLARFGQGPAFEQALIDRSLERIVAPFNERTASRGAVSLPRGSVVRFQASPVLRLFLHWCEPEAGYTTDIDLSVAFFDERWEYAGVCSYYQLRLDAGGAKVATSAGDLQSAPYPDGATEFVDVHLEAARAAGFRYAVMVVNDYAGLPFSALERGFAGIMRRDDTSGAHFDPRTVELRFDLQGDNGVYMPAVIDLETLDIHWLDVYKKGQIALNNVSNSKWAIKKVCPELMSYFGSGVRASLYQVALLNAAARCRRVVVRDALGQRRAFERTAQEDCLAFYHRLLAGVRTDEVELEEKPTLAMLYRGDLTLPEGSVAYTLFAERVTGMLAASDLLKA